ncbi:MAG TPA: sodium/glutamate symporter [Vicinamibacterales bacterium]|nr:sodium/glutamate symporter [Vicinamibacterales bacterium]
MPQLIVRLDMIQTLALASVVLFAGYGIRRRVGVLDRYNIPAPVVGGFLFAAMALTLRLQGVVGARLRRGGDGGRALRLRARRDAERRGEHGVNRREVRSRAARLPGGADGWRVLHRLHQRADHHNLHQSGAMTCRN